MASVNYLYRSTKERSNLILRLLYRYNETDYTFGAKTEFEVDKNYWFDYHVPDKKIKKIKKSKDIDITNKQNDTNTELNKIENHVLNAFKSVRPDEITKDWLQTQIANYYNPPQKEQTLSTELLKYFEYYIECKKTKTTIGTQRKYNSTMRLLERYQKDKKVIIQIIGINESFKNEFENYCVKNNYAQNTISKFFKTIKGVCNHADYNGIETSHQLTGFKTDQHKVEKIYLTFEDLTKIETISKEKLTDSLDNAKDWLIISCYTGQRVSDFMRFIDEQIRIENGKHLLEFTQKKTGKNMTVPLHPKVLEILKKRNGKFPYSISDQKYNDFIKRVCELAKINEIIKGSKLIETEPDSKVYRKKTGTYKKWELVTSHIGRRSFATNFYGKIPTTYLIYITGHSTETMFLNYIGKSNKDLALEITNYF
jgi:integrase